LAQAKANRIYLEEFRKTKKAILMRDASDDGMVTIAAQEREAYSHEEYQKLLLGLKEAVQEEERLRWLMIGAQAKIEVWRSFESSKRAEMRL
jgi:hypothetical protein